MHRRELLTILGSAAAVGLVPRPLLAAGRRVHRAIAGRTARFEYLSSAEGRAVTALADLIIPRTETPGAVEAGVPAFIDVIVGEWLDDAERERFRTGLADVDGRARAAHGRALAECTATEQTTIARELDDEVTRLREARRKDDRSASPDAHVFAMMKSLTVFGYHTSQVGFTQDLKAQLIPGRYIGCAVVPAQ